MKTKLILLFSLVIITLNSNAQQILNVSFIPSQPTTADPVKAAVSLAFPSGGCGLNNEQHSINGTSILAFVYHCMGPLTYICYVTDTIELGLLPAGYYTMNTNLMVGTYDSIGVCNQFITYAMPFDHFTVTPNTGIVDPVSVVPHLYAGKEPGTLLLQTADSRSYHIIVSTLEGKILLEKFSAAGPLRAGESLVRGIYLYKLISPEGNSWTGKLTLD